MTGYGINLHDCPGIDPATQAIMLKAYRVLLEYEMNSAESLIDSYHGMARRHAAL